MKRPIMLILLALISGILLGAYGSMPLLVLGLCLGLFLCLFLYQRYKYFPIFVLLPFMLLGALRINDSLFSFITEPTDVVFSGVVVDVGVTASGNQRATIQGEEIRIMAYIRPHQPWASLGQEIRVTGELRPLSRPTNPVGYNQFQHLRSQKIEAVMWPNYVEIGSVQVNLMVVLRQFRDRVANVFEQVLPTNEARIMQSMVLGERGGLEQELIDTYRAAGIFHILIISGLHMAILMMILNKLLGLVLNERYAGIVVLVIMVLYCLMTGASIATVRAMAMAGILVFSKVLRRDYDLLASVSVVGVVLLIYEPLYLFNMGFQLSFGAVYGIATLTTPVERLLGFMKMRPLGGFRGSFAVGISATFATYVIFIYHFYEIPLYSIFGNLIIMPTATLLLVLGILVGLLGLIWLPLAELLAGPIYFILASYEIGAGFVGSLPSATLLTGGGWGVTLGFFAILCSFAFMFCGYGREFWKRGILLIVSISFLISAVIIRANPRGLHITSLDIAGNYVVLRHRNDVLVIGQARGGENILQQYLNKQGVQQANGIILTQLPRTQDVSRLAVLGNIFDTLYLSGEFTEIEMSMTSMILSDMEARYDVVFANVVYLNDRTTRVNGELIVQVVAQSSSVLDVRVVFRELDFIILTSISED